METEKSDVKGEQRARSRSGDDMGRLLGPRKRNIGDRSPHPGTDRRLIEGQSGESCETKMMMTWDLFM